MCEQQIKLLSVVLGISEVKFCPVMAMLNTHILRVLLIKVSSIKQPTY